MTQAKNPLHGVTLETMLGELVEHFGWPRLGERIAIKSFTTDPSIASSLKFLRKTPWAREKVESLYLFMRREQARVKRSQVEPVAAPFGTWASPVTAQSIAEGSIRLGQLGVMGDDIFWSEGRPQEQGRNALVWRDASGRMTDLTPAPLNVRSRVHEYGGGAFKLGRKAGFFVNDDDQQIWRIRGGEPPHALTAVPGMRHADIEIDAAHKRLICVREDHTGDGEAVTTLVAVSLANGKERVLVSGHDFFSTPRVSPDGRQLAWLSWDHPNMPWDGTTLWLADMLPDGVLGPARVIAGGPDESILQPSWSPRGELHFASDRSGWWNLYRWRDDEVQALHPMPAEFGEPQWAFATSTYGFDARGRIVCTLMQNGRSSLAILDADASRFEPIATPFCSIHELQVGDDVAVFLGATESAPEAVIRLDLRTGDHVALRSTTRTTVDPGVVSRAEAISFPTANGLAAHAFFYRPVNHGHVDATGGRPPLIVVTHGGPTGSTSAAFKLMFQFWTSRGFAIVDVNYGGSSGYGRAYRERLDGQWGVVDVDDAVNAARFLIERGDVDPDRVVIRGASAGGYTTLSALTFRSFFKAGASHYGIGDLEALVLDTHKFESRYLDRLIGPYPAERSLYLERSPVHHTDRLARPMILFQGAEDKAVPPAQAKSMFEAVRAKGLPVAYLLFEGEQHGFRRATTIRRALEAELYFYGKVFGFAPAGAIEPVEIENLASG
ncbi:MAG: prolyl oligopeptidase family serine peptidase [Burkholderiales bacterium]